VIFDAEESVLYTLNETAAEIFRLLKKGLKEKEIVEKIVKKYEVKTTSDVVKRERLEKDVRELIKEKEKNKNRLTKSYFTFIIKLCKN